MKILTQSLHVPSRGNSELIDVTGDVAELLEKSGVREGQVTVFVPGATAGVTTIEFEPGLARDFPEALERIAPEDGDYHHDERWRDGNGHSHVRASLIGPSLTVPFTGGKMTLGAWQQIVVVDCDVRPRKRDVVVQIMGE
jgi:secondary thiamine-phosphate synthase enzyme